jgi:hypothetical protein
MCGYVGGIYTEGATAAVEVKRGGGGRRRRGAGERASFGRVVVRLCVCMWVVVVVVMGRVFFEEGEVAKFGLHELAGSVCGDFSHG